MRRNFLKALAGIAVASLVACAAYAANPHFVEGPVVTELGNQVQVCGKLAGLGNKDVKITVAANLEATVICRNPSGKVVPGQNKVPVRSIGELNISRTEIKNGSVTFCVTTSEPPTITPRQAGCPNDNWSVEITDIEIVGGTITVEQGGKIVIQQPL